ncbi:MAG: hypothetical protein RL679_554, partial [Bacteroidota bacterium]
ELQVPLFLHPRGVPPPLLQFEQPIIRFFIYVKIRNKSEFGGVYRK